MPDKAISHTLVITANKTIWLSQSRIIREIPTHRGRYSRRRLQ